MAQRFSPQLIVGDFSHPRPAARMPLPSVLIFMAKETISGGLRSRAMFLGLVAAFT